MKTKEELQEKVDYLRAQIFEIEDRENNERNKSLNNTYWRYKNSYSCAESEDDKWWVYAKLYLQDGALKCFSFQKDCHGKIEINPNAFTGCHSYYERINVEEFFEEWDEIRHQVDMHSLDLEP